MKITKFTFNGFQENTFVLYDDSGEAVIVDPGCYEREEEKMLESFIEEKNLKPVRLLNTHFHLDHIFGNKFVCDKWNLTPEGHIKDKPTFDMAAQSAELYGFSGFKPSPEPDYSLKEGDVFSFGNTDLDILFTPGHAPGHIVAVQKECASIIGGDVLFNGSIGRPDLPGGDFAELEKSIKEKLYTLPDDYTVYCGHGPETTIGKEKQSNPFVTG